MNRIFLVGNITGDIYFDRLLIKGVERPFLRVILMASRPHFIGGLRIVLWDEKAEQFYPYLQRGSEIGVLGALQTRQFKGKTIHEVEASNLVLMRNLNPAAGEVPARAAGENHVFLVGTLAEDLYYDFFENSQGGRYPFLRLLLTNDQYLDGLRVVLRGSLAELSYPYLRPGSKVAVDGHLQTRDRESGRRVVEVTAEHIAFLDNIDWQAGEAARLAGVAQ